MVSLLKSAFPYAEVDYLVNRGTGEFLEKDPGIRRVLYTRNREARKPVGNPEPGYFLKIFRRYDMAITLNASDRGNLAVLIAGRRIRIGFYQEVGVLKTGWRKFFLTHPLPFPGMIHVARVCQLVAEAIAIPVPASRRRCSGTGRTREEEEFLRREGIWPFFVVHPFARWGYKYRVATGSRASDDLRGTVSTGLTSSPDPGEVRRLREASALPIRPRSAREFTSTR
jgi:heptosyltransferase-3